MQEQELDFWWSHMTAAEKLRIANKLRKDARLEKDDDLSQYQHYDVVNHNDATKIWQLLNDQQKAFVKIHCTEKHHTIIPEWQEGVPMSYCMESRKDDYKDDKLMWDLLPLDLIEWIVKVYHFGAKKYTPNTWQNLPNGYNRYKAALFRHMLAFESCEWLDPESGLPHLAHMAWNALAMLYYALKEHNNNERKD